VRIVAANLVAQAAIVVTGGLVRVTGSGLGCPTWPQCAPGSYTPTERQAESWHKYVEFGNRTLTFVLVIIAAATLVAVVTARPRRRPLVLLGTVPLLGTVAQAVLGGITVLTGLNPYLVSAHFLLTMVIIAASTVLLSRAQEAGDGPPVALVRPEIRAMSLVLVAVTALVLVIGTVVTGSGPNSGDARTEARYPFDPRTVSWLHADLVLLFLGLVVGMILALHLTDAPAPATRRAWWLLAVSTAQGVVGYVQFFAGLPWVVVVVHLLGTTLVWIAAIRLHLSLRRRDALPPTEELAPTRAVAAA
jgi:cytochrome c oxidase assembly protein subunit 15